MSVFFLNSVYKKQDTYSNPGRTSYSTPFSLSHRFQ